MTQFKCLEYLIFSFYFRRLFYFGVYSRGRLFKRAFFIKWLQTQDFINKKGTFTHRKFHVYSCLFKMLKKFRCFFFQGLAGIFIWGIYLAFQVFTWRLIKKRRGCYSCFMPLRVDFAEFFSRFEILANSFWWQNQTITWHKTP